MEFIYRVLKMLILVLVIAVAVLAAVRLIPEKGPEPAEPVHVTEAPQVTQLPQAAEETDSAPESTREETVPAPDITVYDVEGNGYKLSEFRGKPVILNFWASWCGPCRAEMPHIEESYRTYGDQIHFLIVNLTDGSAETVESASEYIAGEGYTFPVYYDTTSEAVYTYGVGAIPATYFIDAEGNLRYYQPGSMSAEFLQQAVDLLLS